MPLVSQKSLATTNLNKVSLTFFGQLLLFRSQHFDFVRELVHSGLFSLRDSTVLVGQHFELKLFFTLYVEQFFAFRVHLC